MPLAAAVTEQLYTGNGVSTGPYVLSAEIETATDLVVTLDGVVTSAYTISGIGSDAGVSVTFDTAPDNGAEIVLARVAPYDRTRYDYQLGNFKPDTVDADVDRVVMLVQQLATALLRVPQLPRGKTSLDLELEPEANKLIGWSADALSLVNLTPATITPSTLVFSAIGQLLAVAASQAAARAAIGVLEIGGRGNRLINSAFDVHQRKTSSINLTTAALNWVVDMWQARTSAAPSGSIAARQARSSTPGEPFAAVEIIRSSGTYAGNVLLEQVLMGSNDSAEPYVGDYFHWAGKTVSVQLKAKRGAGFTGTGIRVYIVTSTSQAGAWGDMVAGAWAGQAATTVIDIPVASLSTSWQLFSGSVTVPAGTRGIAVRIEVRGFTGSGSGTDLVQVSEVSIDREAAAPAYEKLPFEAELLRCMRYYEKSWNYSQATAAGSANALAHRSQGTGGTLDTLRADYKVKKDPYGDLAVTWYSPVTGAAGFVRDTTAPGEVAVTGTVRNGDGSTGNPTIAAAVAGRIYEAHWSVSTITA